MLVKQVNGITTVTVQQVQNLHEELTVNYKWQDNTSKQHDMTYIQLNMRRKPHGSFRHHWQLWKTKRGVKAAESQELAQTRCRHWSLMDPYPGQYSTNSFRLWVVTMTGHPTRLPGICSPQCKDKLLISYIICQLEQHMKTLLGLWKSTTETSKWQWPISLYARPESNQVISHYKSLHQPLSS
jgi:hypothetical protein